MIPTDKIGDFFFMDNDEEEKEYGVSSKVPNFNLSGDILKTKTKENKVSILATLVQMLTFLYRETNTSRSRTSK